MLTRILLSSRRAATVLQSQLRRNYGVTAAMNAQMDPIQKLFVDKIKEYAQKSKSAGGKMVDVDASVEQALLDELSKLDHQFGAKKDDLTKFPTFEFKDPVLEAVGSTSEDSSKAPTEAVDEDVEEQAEDMDRAFWEV